MTEPRNLRTTAHPLIRGAGRQLERLNARHPWDHNAHFHPWILRHLPVDAHRVLDVGCGRGDLLAALSTRAARVEGIDPDPGMAYSAATAHRDRHSVHILRRTLSEHASQTGRAPAYDAITLVASLHHLDLGTALRQVRDLHPRPRLGRGECADESGDRDPEASASGAPAGTGTRLSPLLENARAGCDVQPRPPP